MTEEKQAGAERRLSIVKIYIKDMSFESPQSPAIFRSEDWKPNINLNLRSAWAPIEGDLYEVVLTATIEAKERDSDKALFLAEIHQGGIFEIAGYDKDNLAALTGSFCPNVLFPYAREAAASMIQKGGFPEFVLQPINFDALYMQQVQAKQAEAGKAQAAAAE